MKVTAIILMMLFVSPLLFAQAVQVPVVSNVSFTQRTDGSLMVDIMYAVSDAECTGGDKFLDIDIEASQDNGATWALKCETLSGDVGWGVLPGTNKHVVWDLYKDNPGAVSGGDYKVRVTAWQVGTMRGNDNKVYKTVKIGTQWWMAENLRETLYHTGAGIPLVSDGTAWDDLDNVYNHHARCVYNNDESLAAFHGYLYNANVLAYSQQPTPQNLAPPGWHVPSKSEWETLIDYVGGSDAAFEKLRDKNVWLFDSNGTDEYGFSAHASGYRNSYLGTYYGIDKFAYFWTSSSGELHHPIYVSFGTNRIEPVQCGEISSTAGHSIRLIRD